MQLVRASQAATAQSEGLIGGRRLGGLRPTSINAALSSSKSPTAMPRRFPSLNEETSKFPPGDAQSIACSSL